MHLETESKYNEVAPILVLDDEHKCVCGCNRFKYDLWCRGGIFVSCCQCKRDYEITMEITKFVNITESLMKEVKSRINKNQKRRFML